MTTLDSIAATPADTEAQNKETHICVILDGSSSMEICRDNTIQAFNEFVDQVHADKDKGGDVYVSALVFRTGGNGTEFLYKHQPVDSLVHISRDTYIPSGMTPMNDGIHAAIQELKQYDTPGGNKAFWGAVFTDGEENASELNGEDLSKEIVAQQATGRWTFTVAGANIDLTALTSSLGIPQANALSYAYNPAGIQRMSGQHVNSTAGYMSTRGVGGQAVNDFYDGHVNQNPQVVPNPWTLPSPPFAPIGPVVPNVPQPVPPRLPDARKIKKVKRTSFSKNPLAR